MTILTPISGSLDEPLFTVPDDAELITFLAQLKASEDLSPAEIAEATDYIENMADDVDTLDADASIDPLLASMDEIAPTVVGDDVDGRGGSAPGGADPERTRQMAAQLAADADAPTGDRMTNPSIEELSRKGIEPRGVDQNGLYHIYSKDQGEVVIMSLQEITSPKGLLRLCADYNWWVSHYFKGSKRSTAKEFLALPAGAYLMSLMNKSDRLRQATEYGAGFFVDREGRPLYHDGTALVANGHRLPVSAFRERGVYLRRVSSSFETQWDEISTLSAKERAGIVSVFNEFHFAHAMHREIVMGFTKLGPVSGALDVRPNCWLAAPASTGKSKLLEDVLARLMLNLSHFKGATTEAGLRQSLGVDSRPFIFDEAGEIRPSVLGIIREAFTADRCATVKGGAGGQPSEYRPRGMAMLASVMENLDPNKDAGQNASRFIVLRLIKTPGMQDLDRASYYEETVKPLIRRWCIASIAERLLKESIVNIEVILAAISEFRVVLKEFVRDVDARDVQTYGTHLAGAWLLRNGDRVPGRDEIRTYLRQFLDQRGQLPIESHTAQTAQESIGHRMICELMGSVIKEDISPLARGLTVHGVVETVVDHAMIEGLRLDGPLLPHEKANKIINDLLKNKSAPDRMPADDNAKRRAELHAALLWLYGHGLKVEWYPVFGANNRVQYLPALLIQGKGNDALSDMKKGEKGNWLAYLEQLPHALRTKGAESGTFPDGSRMPNPRRVFSDGKQGNYVMVPWCVIQGGTLPTEAAAPSFDDDDAAGPAGQAAA